MQSSGQCAYDPSYAGNYSYAVSAQSDLVLIANLQRYLTWRVFEYKIYCIFGGRQTFYRITHCLSGGAFLFLDYSHSSFLSITLLANTRLFIADCFFWHFSHRSVPLALLSTPHWTHSPASLRSLCHFACLDSITIYLFK